MSDDLVHGRFRILRPLGTGGAGTTWRARDEVTGRDVTVKRLNTPLTGPAESLRDREARLLAQLDHPQIPAFVDTFIDEFRMQRYLHVVLAFVEGEPLSELLARRRFDQVEARALVDDLLGIVAWLHRLGPPVVHRDIKPSNVIIRPDGRVSLIDFGLATDALDRTFLHTMAAGTLGYQAPEQIAGDPVPASDVYSVGVLALELLTRQAPRTLLSGQTLRWEGCARHLDARWRAWLAGALAFDPADRFRDGTEALAALREVPELRNSSESGLREPNVPDTRLTAGPRRRATREGANPVNGPWSSAERTRADDPRRTQDMGEARLSPDQVAAPPSAASTSPGSTAEVSRARSRFLSVAVLIFVLLASGPSLVFGLAMLEPGFSTNALSASKPALERGSPAEIATLSRSEIARRCLTGEVSYCERGGNRLTGPEAGASDWALARTLWAKGCELRDVASCGSMASLTVDSWEAEGPYWAARACALGDDVNCHRAIGALERREGATYRARAVAELEPGCAPIDGGPTDLGACAVAVWARAQVLGDPAGARALELRACGDGGRCLDAERRRLGIEAP